MATKLSHAPIEGNQVRLRLISLEDIETTRCWRNQDHIRKWFAYSEIIEQPQQLVWFEKYQKLDNDFVYVVELRHTDGWKPIGQISLYAIDWEKKCAEYGRILAGESASSGKGHFQEASQLLIDYWSQQHLINNIFLEVKSDNDRAQRLYEKLGFVRESEQDGMIHMRLLTSPAVPDAAKPVRDTELVR